jgi:hypothetical protein
VRGPDWPATSPLRQVQHFERAPLLRAEAWLSRGRRRPWPFKVGLDVATISRSFRLGELGADMEQLIEAALAHTKALRDGAGAADDYGGRATEEEAQRWEQLAAAARAEVLALRSSKSGT